MNGLAKSTRGLVLALQYFTRVPIPAPLARWTGFSADLQRASLAHFPGIGLLVAALAIACYAAAVLLLPRVAFAHLVAAVLSTAATVLLTGALHEDGLADTFDGLAAGRERERMLQAMKDSRIGGAGAVALVLVLLMKIGLLGLLGSAGGWAVAAAALLGGHVASRALVLMIVATLPNVGSAASSKSLQATGQLEWMGYGIAVCWCMLALAGAAMLTSPVFCLAGATAAAIALLWMRRLFARRLQGYTGDCLGATQQVCEVAFYLGAALALGGA